jgi:hypothetical protein
LLHKRNYYVMHDFKTLDTSALIELLAQHTSQYTARLAEKNANLTQYEYEISLIQSELNARKMTPDNTSVSDPSISIVPKDQDN